MSFCLYGKEEEEEEEIFCLTNKDYKYGV